MSDPVIIKIAADEVGDLLMAIKMMAESLPPMHGSAFAVVVDCCHEKLDVVSRQVEAEWAAEMEKIRKELGE